jgi:ubiquinone/menaquinone biosynthesis C-methylase UbiE
MSQGHRPRKRRSPYCEGRVKEPESHQGPLDRDDVIEGGDLSGVEMTDDTSTGSWNDVADDWVAHADGNDYRNHYLMPRMLAMLGQVAGKVILDVGCGEGGYARELARRGAHVTGVDGSARLIEVARERARGDGVDVLFIQANANALDELESGRFDIVMAAMSLMDVEDYRGAVAEAQRVLRGGGELVMSITHPCFSAPVSEWIRDRDGSLQVFAVDRYFERIAWPEKITTAFSAPVLRRHRPLEDYMTAPLECGLRLLGFCEPGVTDEELPRSHRFGKLRRIPYFLFMRWAKE